MITFVIILLVVSLFVFRKKIINAIKFFIVKRRLRNLLKEIQKREEGKGNKEVAREINLVITKINKI